MRIRLGAMLAAGAFGVTTLGVASPAWATAKPSSKYCDAFEEYHKVTQVYAFSEGPDYDEQFGLSEFGGGDRLRVMAALWGPRLQVTTKTLSTSGPKQTKKLWRSVSKEFGTAVPLLQDVAGFNDEQIDVLRDIDPLDPDTSDLGETLDDNDIDPDDLVKVGDRFEDSIDIVTVSDGASRKELDAIVAAGEDCGVLRSGPPTT